MVYLTSEEMSQELDQCIKDCLECYNVCIKTISHCLQMGGKHAGAGHISLLRDCADVCRANTDLMLRNSGWSGRTCSLCADICIECASNCEKFTDDQIMRECANVCNHTAESCRKVAEAVIQRI
ncbi:MAG: four-helix bundle copper-binding protein [wastewater metagenome]|nr:four-helix bundle copper-binding protein [Candidatus Loosdrechtia aerotolerans]